MKKEDGCLTTVKWLCGILMFIFPLAFVIDSPSIIGVIVLIGFWIGAIFIIPITGEFANQVIKGHLTFAQIVKKMAGPVVFCVIFALLMFTIINQDEKDSSQKPEVTKDAEDAPMVFRTNARCYAAISKEVNHEIVELSAANDDNGLKEMQNDGELFILQENTKVLVIHGGLLQSKIRVEEGKWAGLDLWIDQSFLTHN